MLTGIYVTTKAYADNTKLVEVSHIETPLTLKLLLNKGAKRKIPAQLTSEESHFHARLLTDVSYACFFFLIKGTLNTLSQLMSIVPSQILYLEHGSSRLYAEAIQVVSNRQVCWARPTLLIQKLPENVSGATRQAAIAPDEKRQPNSSGQLNEFIRSFWHTHTDIFAFTAANELSS